MNNTPNIIIDGYSAATEQKLQTMTPEQFKKEHSWQYLLPLFQYFCRPNSKLHIQIICIRDSLPENIESIIRTDVMLQKNKNTILVGNSDLSHLNGHFTDKVHWMRDIMNQDYKTLNSLLSQSLPENASTSACGIGVIRVFLNITKAQKLTPRLMCYYNCCQTNLLNYLSHPSPSLTSISALSANLESTLFANPQQELNSNQGCVGYGSIIYYAHSGKFSAYEQYYMTHLSQYYLLNKTYMSLTLPILELVANQYSNGTGIGMFVTLTNKTNNELMGCIGTLQPIKGTLIDAIYYYTDQAAYHDSRFTTKTTTRTTTITTTRTTTRTNTRTNTSNMDVEITLLFLDRILPYNEKMYDHGLKLVSSTSGKQAFFLPSVREMLIKRSRKPINHRQINAELITMLRRKGDIRENEPIQLYLIPTKRLRGL